MESIAELLQGKFCLATKVFRLAQCGISIDKSRGYIGFTSVKPPLPYILTYLHDYSKTLLGVSFKLGTHTYLGQERKPYFKVTLNSQ